MIEIRLSIIPEETTVGQLRHFIKLIAGVPDSALAFKRDDNDGDFYDAAVDIPDVPLPKEE